MKRGEKIREFTSSYVSFIHIQRKSHKFVYDLSFKINEMIEMANAKSFSLNKID